MELNTTVDMNVSLSPLEEQLHMNPAHWTFNTVLHMTMTKCYRLFFSMRHLHKGGRRHSTTNKKTLETLCCRTRVVVTYETHACTLKKHQKNDSIGGWACDDMSSLTHNCLFNIKKLEILGVYSAVEL